MKVVALPLESVRARVVVVKRSFKLSVSVSGAPRGWRRAGVVTVGYCIDTGESETVEGMEEGEGAVEGQSKEGGCNNVNTFVIRALSSLHTSLFVWRVNNARDSRDVMNAS